MSDNVGQSGNVDEEAVRQYLQYLRAPDSFVDEDHIRELRARAQRSEDVIERVRLLAEAHRAEKVDDEPLRAGFVAHAKAWADAGGVPAAVFQEMGVPADVLADAGFTTRSTRRSRSGSGPGRPSGARARRVSIEQIREHVLGRTAPFTLKDVGDGLGGSPMTIRKAVDALVAEGAVERLGPVPDYRGRGRAPTQYRTKA